MKNGVLWDHLTTPRLSIWSSDVMCAVFVQGGKQVNTVQMVNCWLVPLLGTTWFHLS